MAKTRTTPADFIKVVQKSSSAEDAAKALGMKVSSVKSKIYYYRSIGVENIKSFPRKRDLIDVSELSKIAGSLLPKGALLPKAKKNKKTRATA